MTYRCHSPRGFKLFYKQDGHRVEESQSNNEGKKNRLEGGGRMSIY